MDIFKKLGWFFKRQRKRYTIGVLFLIMTSFANLVPPRILGIMANHLDAGKITWQQFGFEVLAVVLAAVLLYLFRYFWRKEILGGSVILEQNLRDQLFTHFLSMDKTFFQRHRTGDLMAHATNDIQAVQNVAGDGVLTLVDGLFTGGSTIIAMMVFVDWRLTIVAILPLPLLAIMAKKLGTKLHDAYSDSQAAFSRLNNKTQESIAGIKVLKTFGQGQQDAAAFNQMTYDTIKINKKVFRIDAMYDPLTTIIIAATYVITIIYGGLLVNNGQISLGQLVSFVAYIGAMVWPMFAVGYLFNILERGSASYDRIMQLLDEKSLIKDAGAEPDAHPVKIAGNLHYAVSSFAYPDEPEKLALQQIDFDLKPGQTLGLVGRVGAGKTTIIQLLMREFDNYQGRITIGGHDIRSLPLDDWLRAIAYVPQDNFLFSTSIKDNLNFGKNDASAEEIQAAAKKAALHEDIMQMPNGYHTLVGENGISLSGGQKQRMSIARALLLNSQILILDDALSAVDAKTEAEILRNLRADRQDKTTIISSHKLSAVMDADQILVLKDGQIIERGTHQTLLEAGGWYKRMWDKQELENSLGGEDNE